MKQPLVPRVVGGGGGGGSGGGGAGGLIQGKGLKMKARHARHAPEMGKDVVKNMEKHRKAI